MTPKEAIEILEEVKELDDTLYAYSSAYMEALEAAISTLKEIQQYREIGTVEECREAVEKQKPKRKIPVTSGELYGLGFRYKCPNCGSGIKVNSIYYYDICKICGQKISNEESEEE